MYTQLKRALQAEFIKSRHTKTFWQLLILAAAIPLLIGFVQILGIERMGGNIDAAPSNFASKINNISGIFSLLFYPMGIVLIAAQVNSIEHKNSTWQLIETQPTPKWAIYLAKFIKLIWGMTQFVLLFYVITFIIFYLIYIISEGNNPSYYFKIEFSEMALRALNMVFAGMGYAAVFFVLNIIFKKTNLITSIGIVSVIGYMIANGLQFDFPRWFPLVHLGVAAGQKSDVGEWVTYYSRISIVLAIVILFLGFSFYSNKSRRSYFFKSSKGLMIHLLTWVLGIGIIYWMQLPRYQGSYGTTIIAGHIESDIPVKEINLSEINNKTTIATIPIKEDGSFHINLSEINIPKQHYIFSLGDGNIYFQNSNGEGSSSVFITNGDSIHVELGYKDNFTSIKISGDRRAEANARIATSPFNLIYLNQMMNFERTKSMTVDLALKNLLDYYEKDKKSVTKHLTIDGFVVGKDIQDYQINLLKVYYVQAWNNIIEKHFPENINQEFPEIEAIKNSIDSQDEDLWLVEDFVNYQLGIINKGEIVTDQNRFELIEKINSEKGRENAYFLALQNVLISEELSDSNTIQLYDQYGGKIKDQLLKRKLEQLKSLKMMRSNATSISAYAFYDKNDSLQSLEQFSGKHILIYLWSRSCQACSFQTIGFYDAARKYTDKNIVFIAITADPQIDSWKGMQFPNEHVVNYRCDAAHPLIELMRGEPLPQFILVSPSGSIITSDVPNTNSEEFEALVSSL